MMKHQRKPPVTQRELTLAMNELVIWGIRNGRTTVDALRQLAHPAYRRFLPETLAKLKRRGIIRGELVDKNVA